MDNEKKSEAPPPANDSKVGGEQKRSRELSTIGFPYGDLEDAISVAAALLGVGGVPCEPDQLAAAMKHTPSSGSFRQKIATARMFGLIETVQNKYQLTSLGFAITDASRQKAARADAFLNVPLYRKVYDTFRNQQLPPRPLALERTFIGFGVAQKQAANARVAFDSSAQQAGYFEQSGRERLIRPPGAALSNSASESTDQSNLDAASFQQEARDRPAYRAGSNGGSGGGRHPFIEGLLERLPEPDTVWSIEGRAAWLEAAASVFKLIYQGDGRITITVETRSEKRA
jgi:hypothetical protein